MLENVLLVSCKSVFSELETHLIKGSLCVVTVFGEQKMFDNALVLNGRSDVSEVETTANGFFMSSTSMFSELDM